MNPHPHRFARVLLHPMFAGALALAALPLGAQTPPAASAATDDAAQALIVRSAERVYNRELYRLGAAKTLNVDAATVSRVRSAVDPLVGHARDLRPDKQSWHWSANVETNEAPLLYCLPGGRIMVSTGFLNRVRPNPSELTALLAHAIAHALDDRDGEEAMAQLAKRGEMADPDPNRVETRLGEAIVKRVLDEPRSPEAEQHADALALELLARSAQDPRTAAAAWSKVAALTDTRPPAFPALHPTSENRSAAMAALLPAMVAQYEEAKRNLVPAEEKKAMPQGLPQGQRGKGQGKGQANPNRSK